MNPSSPPGPVRPSLHAHAAAKGLEIRERYGPRLGWRELTAILEDRNCVRYPCEIVFDSRPLLPGECAHPVGRGGHPEEGFVMYVHPFFMTRPDRIPYLVLYQLVLVNYGDFAAAEDAEIFGANALGISPEGYYRAVCGLADELSGGTPCGSPPTAPSSHPGAAVEPPGGG